MREAREDPNLADVKAVLKKLQRLDVPSAAEQSPPAEIAPKKPNSTPASSPNRGSIGVFDRKHAAFAAPAPAPKSRARPIPLYAAGALALVAGAGVLFATGVVKIPGETKLAAQSSNAGIPIMRKEEEAALLTEARRLLNDGDVSLARDRLLHGGPEQRAEFAFMLAQSFDPNYLRALPKANGLPDRGEAERWYRKWYELAVNSGLEMDSGRLKRIINAMH